MPLERAADSSSAQSSAIGPKKIDFAELSSLCHLRELLCVLGGWDAGAHCLGSAHDRDLRAPDSDAAHHFNRVLDDLLLLLERRQNIEAAVGDTNQSCLTG